MIPFLNFEEDFLTTEDLLFLAGASGVKGVEDTATGNPLTFQTDLAKPLKSLLIHFTPKQEGTGDPSPSNIRSILPWDGLTVFGGGKNLFDVSTVVKGTLDGTGVLVENNNRRTSAYITLGAGKYKLSRKTLVDWWKAWSYKLDGTPIRKLFDGNGYEVTLTLTEMCMIRISFNYVVTDENDVQLEAGETATAYEPYKPITETDISFPSPVYGGEHEAVSGRLMNEWAEIASYNGETLPGEWLSDRDVYQAGTTPTIGAQVVYKLATPVEIQLTPSQITTLVGDNTIWSDADGSITAVYLKNG